MNLVKKIFAATVIVAVTVSAQAQNPMSPYSKYGYGILNDNATSAQRAMGGVGYAMSSGRQINAMNPASYAAIDSLTFLFDMGLTTTALWSKEGNTSGKDFGGGLDYITMQFPITKYLGGSIGLVPLSSVGYSFGSKVDNGTSLRQGSGGLNQLYFGLGVRPFTGLTLGTNIGYLFGTTINDSYVTTSAGSTTLFERVIEVRDYRLQFGIQYALPINGRDKLTAGVTYTPGKTLLGHTWGIKYDVNADTDGSGAAVPDTVGYTSLKGKYSLPETWGIGLNYVWNEKLMVEADFTYQPWKNADFDLNKEFNESTEFNNRWKFALGAQLTPRARGNYAQRVNYRLGGFYSNDYIKVRGNNVREYGLTMGFGLPAPGSKTVINLGFEWRHRQANPMPLIKENYFSVTLGVNFNELWFYQSKIR